MGRRQHLHFYPHRLLYLAVVIDSRKIVGLSLADHLRAQLVAAAKDMQEAMKRHEELGLNPDEEAFYDALADRPEVLLIDGRCDVEEAGERADGKAAEQHDVGLAVPRQRAGEDENSHHPPEGCEEAIVLVVAQAQALADDWFARN